MCINCSLITPMTDEICELLGIEKRKYLSSPSLLPYKFKKDIKCKEANSFSVVNYMTYGSFKLTKCKKINLKDIVSDEIFSKIQKYNNYGRNEFIIYEGKIEVLGPVNIKYKSNKDQYIELFTGPIEYVPEEYVYKPSVPPSLIDYRGF